MKIRPILTLKRLLNGFVVAPIVYVARLLSPDRLVRSASRKASGAVKTVASITGDTDGIRPARRWTNLLIGLPAILVALGGILFTARAVANQRGLGQQYWRQALNAIGEKDYPAAQLYLTRATTAGDVDSREIQFALAVVYGELGYSGRSMEVFQQLAPVNRTGFAKAHRHLAMLISSDQSTARNNDTLAAWLWHLQHADEQESAAIQESWGNYYLAVDDIRSAIPRFANAASKQPRLYLLIANLFQKLGQVELRKEMLQRSRDRFAEKVSVNPYDRDSRIVYASSLLALGELVEAEQVLRTGLRLDPDGPFRTLLAATFVQLHDQLMDRGTEYQSEALQQLRNAFEFDPNFGLALNRLLGYAKVDDAAIPELEAMLHEILASGKGTALAHLALSNLAWLSNDNDATTFHLEQAIALDADMPVIANNLAWVLSHEDPPELERALRIADKVVSKYPSNPRFLDTRGTIYVLMGQYSKGITDLEKALPGLKNRTATHKQIAEAYRQMGMEKVAKSHERKANE